MPVSPQGAAKSMTQYLLDNINNAKPESTAELAHRLKMPRATVEGLLYQRSITKGGVYRLHGQWHTGTFEGDLAQANASGITAEEARKAIKRFKKPAPPEYSVAQIREPRPFVELTAATIAAGRLAIAGAPAMRAGADDHKRIPSLYGEHRVTYKGAQAVTTTASAAGSRSGLK